MGYPASNLGDATATATSPRITARGLVGTRRFAACHEDLASPPPLSTVTNVADGGEYSTEGMFRPICVKSRRDPRSIFRNLPAICR